MATRTPSGGWCLIESDPGVFAALVERIGVRGVSFSEVYGLDELSFEALEAPETYRKLLGFIFLFNWAKDRRNTPAADPQLSPNALSPGDSTSDDTTPFFAAQTIENACASQAIVSVLLNRREEVPDLGVTLKGLFEFTRDFRDPAMRGEAIGGCEAIREAHNSFHTESSFELEESDDGKSKDAFHFVSYVPIKSRVFELDGLKSAPVCIGEANDGDWKEVVRKEVLRRIEQIQAQGEELRFNLMAVTTSPRDGIDRELTKTIALAAAAASKLQGGTADPWVELPAEPQQIEKVRRDAETKIALLEEQLRVEDAKLAEWNRENARRRHDFTPFVLCALRHLARRGELVGFVRKAAAVIRETGAAPKKESAAARGS